MPVPVNPDSRLSACQFCRLTFLTDAGMGPALDHEAVCASRPQRQDFGITGTYGTPGSLSWQTFTMQNPPPFTGNTAGGTWNPPAGRPT